MKNFILIFFWLSAHAIEKYLKGLLLINNHCANNYSHDIYDIYEKTLKLIPDITIPVFLVPHTDHSFFYKETVIDYFKRLTKYGDPTNRYMLYGYNQQQVGLFKVDHIIWHLRWYCKHRYIKIDGNKILDSYKFSKTNNWQHIGISLPLEKYAKDKNKNELLKRLNYSFYPNINHQPYKWQLSSKNPPLCHYVERLKKYFSKTRR